MDPQEQQEMREVWVVHRKELGLQPHDLQEMQLLILLALLG